MRLNGKIALVTGLRVALALPLPLLSFAKVRAFG
jgi:hypothetical protein